jgi:hypothetical protein
LCAIDKDPIIKHADTVGEYGVKTPLKVIDKNIASPSF